MMLPLCKSFTSIMIYVIITGLVDGCYTVLLPTLTEAFTGEDKKVLAWGILNFFASITFTLGPPVAGTGLSRSHLEHQIFPPNFLDLFVHAVCLSEATCSYNNTTWLSMFLCRLAV